MARTTMPAVNRALGALYDQNQHLGADLYIHRVARR
jgi:hypothetical protein